MLEATLNNRQIRLVEGDITDLTTEAIVNAANSDLILGAGVAGAIRRKGGPAIQKECDEIGTCRTGRAVITSGGKLPARYVIHAVGPQVSNPDGEELLFSATLNSLLLAEEHGITSIAFPAISTGIFGFPIHECARLMVEATLWFLTKEAEVLQSVVFCLFDKRSLETFQRELSKQISDM